MYWKSCYITPGIGIGVGISKTFLCDGQGIEKELSCPVTGLVEIGYAAFLHDPAQML